MWCRESAGRHRRVHFPYGDVREKHTHIMYSTTCTHRGFSVLLTAAVCMCVQTTHVMFLSIICHTYCTIIVLLSAIIPAGIFIFCQHDTQCVQLCVGRDPSVLVCVCLLYVSVVQCMSVQVVVTSQLFCISELDCLSFQNVFFFFYTNFL